MKGSETEYCCVNCSSQFVDIWCNHYDFSRRKAFVFCPNCKAKLVMDYNFDLSTKLTDYGSNAVMVSAIITLIVSLIWDFKPFGFYILSISCAIGIPLFLASDSLRKAEWDRAKKTRLFVS